MLSAAFQSQSKVPLHSFQSHREPIRMMLAALARDCWKYWNSNPSLAIEYHTKEDSEIIMD